MLPNVSTYRAKSFVAERDMTSMAFEVKRTRAVWDASLRIPGTNRSGGWRCPVGTRYGGQITDRFGRNCGWGVARRLANEISDLGERLESVGDRRRGRRLERRNRRMVQRLQGQGRVERVAGRVAEALESDTTPNRPVARPARAVTPERPPRPATPRRQRQGQVARRRRGNLRDSELRRMDREIEQPGAPRTGEIDRGPVDRPRPAAPRARRRRASVNDTQNRPADVVAPEREPAKKAAAKKAPAKKAAAKKAAPAKKAAKKRVPAKKTPVKKTTAQKVPAEKVPARGYNPDDAPLGNAEGEAEAVRALRKAEFAPDNARMFRDMANQELQMLEGLDDNDVINVRTGNGLRKITVAEHRRHVEDLRAAYQEIIDYHDARGGNALIDENGQLREFRVEVNEVFGDGELVEFGRQAQMLDWEANPDTQMAEENRIAMQREQELLDRIDALGAPQHAVIAARPNANTIARDMRLADLRRSIQESVWARERLLERYEIAQARQRANENVADIVGEERVKKAREKVDAAVKKHQKRLAEYLNERYGEGNAPWKEMNSKRLDSLMSDLMGGDEAKANAAKTELESWISEMFVHPEIKGANGKKYRIVGNPTVRNNNGQLVMRFDGFVQRQDERGQWIRVGRTERDFRRDRFNNDELYVYNERLIIDNQDDKGAGIATIYNHHAFMYQKAAGLKRVGVTAAMDGPYVWGRFGYRSRIYDENIINAQREIANFRAGRNSIIRTEGQARIWEGLIEEHNKWKQGANNQFDPAAPLQPYRHIDFIYAIDVEDENHREQIRNWFVARFPMNGGEFLFDENGIVDDPREVV